MHLVELIQAIATAPGRTLGEYLHANQQVSTTEFLASVMDALASGVVVVTPDVDRNPLDARIHPAAFAQAHARSAETTRVAESLRAAPWARPLVEPARKASSETERFNGELQERLASLQRQLDAEKDAHAKTETSFTEYRRQVASECESVRGELSVLADSLRAERPNVARTIDNLLEYLPHAR